ncbi:MAG: Uma2 family endonuclease, partial [Isosphaeraceae bacterium]
EEMGDQHVLLAYNRGVLEFMSPGPMHEDHKGRLNRLVYVLTEELDVPCKGYGSTMWKALEAHRGLEADDCFYLTIDFYLTIEKITAARQPARDRSNDSNDYPRPDLAIEIDLRPSAVDRPEIYATLGVPEVWRYDGETLRISRLGLDGTYADVAESGFLAIKAEEVVHWLQDFDTEGTTARARLLREWIRAELIGRVRDDGS